MSSQKSNAKVMGMIGFLLILLGLALLIGSLIAFVLHKTGTTSTAGQWLDMIFYTKGLSKYSVIAGFVSIGVGAMVCYLNEK